MNQTIQIDDTHDHVSDEELIGVLNAISVVSKRLAKNSQCLPGKANQRKEEKQMSKMSELAAEIAELRKCAETIIGIADSFTQMFSGNDEPTDAPIPEPALTLEAVRAVLADKSRNGHTAEIRSLLQKYGAAKLSEIDPANYKALLAEAEVLT